MSKDKKVVRKAFRDAVFQRDGYRCRVCGEPGDERTLDAHHITDRHDMPNGGYVKENGITLCKKEGGCHEKAEQGLQLMRDNYEGKLPAIPDLLTDMLLGGSRFHPVRLYRLVGSSYEKAVEAAKGLSDG